MKLRDALIGLATLFSSSAAAMPVIIDTDMAIDDWFAVLYLMMRPETDVVGITVTGTGEATCAMGMENALKLAKLAGQPNIPVSCGREFTDAYGTVFPTEWRIQADTLLGITLPASDIKPLDTPAHEFIHDVLSQSAEPVTILAIGPLTNISDFVSAYGDQHTYLKEIMVMGGAVHVSGNVNITAHEHDNYVSEWNLYVDPTSAQHVIHSALPITLVPLDATNHVKLNSDFFDSLAANVDHPVAQFIYDVLSLKSDFVHGDGWYFWDSLAASAIVRPDLVTKQTMPIYVPVSPLQQQGRTRFDINEGYNVCVSIAADAHEFKIDFIETINARVTKDNA